MHRTPFASAYELLLSTGRLKADPSQTTLAASLGRLQHHLITQTRVPSKGLYIYGGVGTGKSRIADLFASTLPKSAAQCRRTHFFEFMTDVHSRLHRARMSSTYSGDALVQIGSEVSQESPVLCLDEFQVSDIADAMILKRLFTSFWDEGGILVSTSNRHPTELYKNGLNRGLFLPFIDELQRRCNVFKMEQAEDYRMAQRPNHSREDAFYQDENAFQADLTLATNGESFKPVEITVIMSRKLHVQAHQPARGKAIVSSTFDSLCKEYLGSTDYHALCNFASTIYLSNLRQFAADEVDVVRRFITLVDIAYESRTRVLCQSTHSVLQTFKNIVMSSHSNEIVPEPIARLQDLMVKGEGGSSSSHATTFIGSMEWSATGRKEASLATGGAGETDVRFAVLRTISRLHEMTSEEYGQ